MTQPVEQHSELMREIDEAFAELGWTAEYVARLLEILHRGWLRGPRTIPFNPNYDFAALLQDHSEKVVIPADGYIMKAGSFLLGWTVEKIWLTHGHVDHSARGRPGRHSSTADDDLRDNLVLALAQTDAELLR